MGSDSLIPKDLLLVADPLLSERIARIFPEAIARSVSKRISRNLAERDPASRVAEANPSSSRAPRCVDGADLAFGPEGGFALESGAHSSSHNLPLGSCACDEYAPVEVEFETCRTHWSELMSSGIMEQEEIAEANREAFRRLQKNWPDGFFEEVQFDLELQGEKIAEGGQGEIYIFQGLVWKLFKLQDASLLPLGLYQNYVNVDLSRYYCWVRGVRLLKDGRVAFQMWRYWGDLRRLIDLRMQENNKAKPPFSYCVAYRLMWEIACGMRNLLDKNIPHRDLKAANVLIMPFSEYGVSSHRSNHCPRHSDEFGCVVADYEFSIGVMGTRFWRAPEILQAVKERSIHSKLELFSERADVYSYAVTCYEILTGRIPFEGLEADDYEAVYGGQVKLEWPEDVDPQIKALLEECCHLQPSKRPTFQEICERLHIIWNLFQGEIAGVLSSCRDLNLIFSKYYSLLQSGHELSKVPPNLQLMLPGILSGLYGMQSAFQGGWRGHRGAESTILGSRVLSDDGSCSSDDGSYSSDDDP